MSWSNGKNNNTFNGSNHLFNGRIFFLSESLKCYLVGGGNLNGRDDDSGSLGVNLSKNLLKSNHSKITLSLKFPRK